MAKNLLIVESPAKAKTISQYLGSDFQVLSSYGHIRDLPKSKMSIDIKNGYEADYIIPDDSKKTIATLSSAMKGKELWLATDFDREGEAIAWHLVEALKPKKEPNRIVFTEITKSALLKAVKNPRKIDQLLVEAQQARRILDRLVGYSLSPILWDKIARGLSAGRVQSVAVRLVCEKEDEIKKFKEQEFWNVKAQLKENNSQPKSDHPLDEKNNEKTNSGFWAELVKKNQKPIDKLEIKDKVQANKLKSNFEKSKWIVSNIDSRENLRYPSPPFITSTLQQAASTKHGYGAKRTMRIAQGLYEGVNLGSKKRTGLITYMRTDSISVSEIAIQKARLTIEKVFGKEYLPEKPRYYKTKKKSAQEAHEAIRPTKPELTPNKIQEYLNPDQFKLYFLIWKKFIASQMKEAKVKVMTIEIDVMEYGFLAKDEEAVFGGYLKAWDKNIESKNRLPNLKIKDELNLVKLDAIQNFTKPPARYTEASLIKALEQLEIGRPSTYAPTMDTIQYRGYIKKEGAYLIPTDIAYAVIKLLLKQFDEIIDYKFTAQLENDLDSIADGKLTRKKVLDEFWQPFSKDLKIAEKNIKKEDFQEKTGENCPECKKPLIERFGRYGRFQACSGYPKCKFSQPIVDAENKKEEKEIEKQTQEKCEKCGSEMVLKEGRFGQFLACTKYPKCKFTKAILKKTGDKCPDCKKGEVIEKKTKRGKVFWGCSNYPKCKWASWVKPGEEKKDKKEN